jgi:hypothetical protein
MEKKDIATVQLRAAARLYRSGDYVSSLTLSSAAEEILGKIAKKRRVTNSMQRDVEISKAFYDITKKEFPEFRLLANRINKIKNEIKHNDDGENTWIEADFEFEAFDFFTKAVANYYLAYNEYPRDRVIMGVYEMLRR